jgi:hypothetical protein
LLCWNIYYNFSLIISLFSSIIDTYYYRGSKMNSAKRRKIGPSMRAEERTAALVPAAATNVVEDSSPDQVDESGSESESETPEESSPDLEEAESKTFAELVCPSPRWVPQSKHYECAS